MDGYIWGLTIEIKAELVVYYTDVGKLYFLEKDGEQVAKVLPCDNGQDLSILKEGEDDNREVSKEIR